MGQPRIIEIPYQEFLTILRRATDSGKKIQSADKERWNRFIREHKVPEAGMAVKARSGAMSGKTRSVIVDGAGKLDGFYIYSAEDQFCLKYDLGRE